MKATPIAQYLEQKGRGGTVEWPSARREPLAFKPRIAAAEEASRAPPAFRPAGLVAAVGAEAARRDATFPRASAAPPAPDIEERLSEAYHRGVQEGLDVAREEAAAARSRERAETQRRSVVERLDFQMNEYAKLADLITSAFGEIERGIAESVARILNPLVSRAIASQIVEELAQNIARLRQSGRPGLLRIRGPEPLLAALKQRLAPLALDVEYGEEAGVEVIVEAGETTIVSGLKPWTELIGSLVERD
jgi:flagellar biosynthesis/type III secretory pathway protein FliH